MKNPIVNMDAVIQVLGLNLLDSSIFAAVGGLSKNLQSRPSMPSDIHWNGFFRDLMAY